MSNNGYQELPEITQKLLQFLSSSLFSPSSGQRALSESVVSFLPAASSTLHSHLLQTLKLEVVKGGGKAYFPHLYFLPLSSSSFWQNWEGFCFFFSFSSTVKWIHAMTNRSACQILKVLFIVKQTIGINPAGLGKTMPSQNDYNYLIFYIL